MAQEKSTNVSVQYGHTQECSGVLFELPDSEVQAGDNVEMRLWGGTIDLLYPYTLYKGTDTMGAGEILEAIGLEQIEQIIDFPEKFSFQLDYPIISIDEVLAVTEIFYQDVDGEIYTWATKGELITNKFSRNGYSCIFALDKINLYGSIKAIMTRSPWYKRWYWTVPAQEQGQHWFFIWKGSELTNKFSIELPDLISPIKLPKNVTLKIVNRHTDAGIAGAEVTVDGTLMGTTDGDGRIFLGTLLQGTHTLFLRAGGFIDSDEDDLANDSFEVY